MLLWHKRDNNWKHSETGALLDETLRSSHIPKCKLACCIFFKLSSWQFTDGGCYWFFLFCVSRDKNTESWCPWIRVLSLSEVIYILRKSSEGFTLNQSLSSMSHKSLDSQHLTQSEVDLWLLVWTNVLWVMEFIRHNHRLLSKYQLVCKQWQKFRYTGTVPWTWTHLEHRLTPMLMSCKCRSDC